MTTDTLRHSAHDAAAAPFRAPSSAPAGLRGLHHVAVVARDGARAADFYGRLLGLTELGDGPAPAAAPERPGELAEAPARWFAGASGAGLVAVVERPDAAPGAPGIGGTHHVAFAVADRAALLMWKRRFLDAGHAVTGILDRHYFQSLYVNDPDGQIIELATMGPGWTVDEAPGQLGEAHRDPPAAMVNTNRDRARIAAESWPDPVPDVAPRMRVAGLHHVTAIGAGVEGTHAFLAGRLGLRRVKRTRNFDDVGSLHWYWGAGDGAPGTLVTYFERRPEREGPARMGVGQVAHYAVAAAAEAVDPLGAALAAAGLPASRPAVFGPDGARFRALATRDPDGHPVLVAATHVATHGPAAYGARAAAGPAVRPTSKAAGADLLAAALLAVVDGRPLPESLRPAVRAVPRPATVEAGFAWILRDDAPGRRAGA